jgi:hypothetical protein
MRPCRFIFLLTGCAAAQIPDHGPLDLLDLPRLKTISAERVSSGVAGASSRSRLPTPGAKEPAKIAVARFRTDYDPEGRNRLRVSDRQRE